ncbi:MAG: Crp/Fnr family transcriptional regulator [Paracoccaceae bacterium]
MADGYRGVLARSFLRRPLAVNETLFAQGAPNDAVYCLSRGMVALRSYRADGGSALVRLVYPGDVFGFRSFLVDDPHQTEATALVPSRVCLVARREARQVVTGSPQTLERIARRCAQELTRARNWQRATVKTGNHKRLAQLIVQLTEGLVPEPSAGLHLPLSRQDMAAALGVEAETVSRLIARLRDEAGLQISGRWVDPGSLDRLRAIG